MSSTRDWMRGGGQIERPAAGGLPLAAMVAWTLGLVIVAAMAVVLVRLAG